MCISCLSVVARNQWSGGESPKIQEKLRTGGWCSASVFTWLFYDQDALAQSVGYVLSIKNADVASNQWHI